MGIKEILSKVTKTDRKRPVEQEVDAQNSPVLSESKNICIEASLEGMTTEQLLEKING